MSWSERPVRVRVPATSANLGPGFDTLGLALALYDEVEARVTSPSSGPSVSISVSGEGAGDVADSGEDHLVIRAMRAAFDELGCGQPPGIDLRCVNRIPHGRGLGSSAAAITAGILAARTLAGAPARPEDVLPLATAMEGHPDNVAPCLYGGLTIAWLSDNGPRSVRLLPLPGVRPVVAIAPAPVSTEVARGLLPDKVTHADAAVNAGRAALLVAALTACPDALLDATADLLHQDYRAPAMPATHDLVRRLRAAGVPAVVSGAGPSVLAFLVDSGGNDPPQTPPAHGGAARPPVPPAGRPSGPPAPHTSTRGTTRPSGPPSPAGGRLQGPHTSGLDEVAGSFRDDLDKLDSTLREAGIEWRISPLDIERQGASVTSGVPGVSVVW